MSKVAVITGGASGLGLQVAKFLAAKGDWELHLFDMNAVAGKAAVESLGPIAHFHQVNVTSYDALAQAFEDAFKASNRLDFVYANAGIQESGDIYAVHEKSGPPPRINQLVVELSLTSIINTVYLAKHYLSTSPHGGQGSSIVITGSAGSVYALDSAPMYAAAKFGALGFTWSIAKVFFKRWGIRVNAVLPAPVRTNLVADEVWQSFDQSLFTPAESVAGTVLKFVDGQTMTDAKGVSFSSGELYGRAAEVVTTDFFFHQQAPFCNEAMRAVMSGNDL